MRTHSVIRLSLLLALLLALVTGAAPAASALSAPGRAETVRTIVVDPAPPPRILDEGSGTGIHDDSHVDSAGVTYSSSDDVSNTSTKEIILTILGFIAFLVLVSWIRSPR